MGLTNPDITVSEPFTDALKEDEAFRLLGVRVVDARSKDYGDGRMVLLKVQGQEKELSVWGTYLLAQAEAVERSDLDRDYVLTRGIVEGYSDRPVKMLKLAETTRF